VKPETNQGDSITKLGRHVPTALRCLRHINIEDKKGYSRNKYRYNLKGSSPKPLPAPSPPEHKKVQPNEIKRSPNSRIFLMLLLILFGEGLDAYWMMSKDLENKVDDINMMENPPRICY
jgi:hypothetical protein